MYLHIIQEQILRYKTTPLHSTPHQHISRIHAEETMLNSGTLAFPASAQPDAIEIKPDDTP